jgi:hypothetical protein
MISQFQSTIAPNPPPGWLWVPYILMIILCALWFAKRVQPKEKCYLAEEMEAMFPELFHPEKGPINPMELYFDPTSDLFIAEEEFSEGQRWYVFTPVTRGIWKVYNTWWLTFVALCGTAIILPLYMFVHPLGNTRLMRRPVFYTTRVGHFYSMDHLAGISYRLTSDGRWKTHEHGLKWRFLFTALIHPSVYPLPFSKHRHCPFLQLVLHLTPVIEQIPKEYPNRDQEIDGCP